MQFSLLTYDSTLALNAGYSVSSNAVEFQQTLSRLTDDFAKYSGVPKANVYWMEVTNSDWCKNMLLLYARVPADWQPQISTHIVDAKLNPDWYPHLARGFWQWVRGGGECIDRVRFPPETPHQLFKSI